jgi:uncharacterized protein YfkK (UPF0435 family)
MSTTNEEIKVLIQQLAIKLEILNNSVAIHQALDTEKSHKIDQIFMDIHGDGNSKKGIRRELDRVLDFIESTRKFVWIIVSAAVTSVVAALIAIFWK